MRKSFVWRILFRRHFDSSLKYSCTRIEMEIAIDVRFAILISQRFVFRDSTFVGESGTSSSTTLAVNVVEMSEDNLRWPRSSSIIRDSH